MLTVTLLVFGLSPFVGSGAWPAAAATGCTPEQVRQGVCDTQVVGEINGGSAVLTGIDNIPGGSTPGSSAPGTPGTGTGAGTGTGGPQTPPILSPEQWCIIRVQFDPTACEATPPGPTTPGVSTPAVTIADVATFIPTPGRQQMEPDGWTVAGLDTNFYAITEPHVVSGSLLGRAADVRFTPAVYLWAYGDGTSATRNTRGGTWASQGIAEFEPTPTSHVYERLGEYTITLSMVFAAEYRFAGSPWRPVVGTITLPANDLHLRVGSAKTVLVEHDCLADPAGPGC